MPRTGTQLTREPSKRQPTPVGPAEVLNWDVEPLPRRSAEKVTAIAKDAPRRKPTFIPQQ